MVPICKWDVLPATYGDGPSTPSAGHFSHILIKNIIVFMWCFKLPVLETKDGAKIQGIVSVAKHLTKNSKENQLLGMLKNNKW